MLASEYGWTKRQILYEVYPEELPILSEQIERRNIDEYIIQLRIATNPHLKPENAKDFVEGLMGQRRKLHGEDPRPPLDVDGLDQLKNRLSKESKMVKVN